MTALHGVGVAGVAGVAGEAGVAGVAVVGDVLVDVVVVPRGPVQPDTDTPSTVRWAPGGAAVTVALTLAGLGVPVRLVGRVGDDAAATILRQGLQDAGVEAALRQVPAARTGTVVAVVQGDRRDMLTDRGASADLGPDDLPPGWLDGIGHVHLSGYVLLSERSRPGGAAAARQAAAAGLSVSVDPSSVGDLLEMGSAAFLDLLPGRVLLLPSEEEARVLTGVQDVRSAALALARRVGEVVVTRGPAGAVWSDGADVLAVPAVAVTGAVDPVGAGDAFTGGLLAARRDGADVQAQLQAAVLAASARITRAR